MGINIKLPNVLASKRKLDGNEVSGTKEWASLNVNLISGCEYDCKYCYAKSMAVRFKRKTIDSWKNETVNFRLLSVVPSPSNNVGYTMFPSSHDITPENLCYTTTTINLLLDKGHRLLLVTKPNLHVVKEIVRQFTDRKDQILFRFTIGSADSETLKFWEPNAPSFEERYSALRFAYLAGFKTGVSCEPALDTNTGQLIDILLPYVTDAIWVGLPNRLRGILKLNGVDDKDTLEQAGKLIEAQSAKWVMELFNEYWSNPQVKWKDSIKKIIGLDRPTKSGLDI